ncbi:MAG: hypothetical protein V1750_08545 [Acidobacteriota bacterium]
MACGIMKKAKGGREGEAAASAARSVGRAPTHPEEPVVVTTASTRLPTGDTSRRRQVAGALARARAGQRLDETGGFAAFIPWTFQEAHTPPEGEVELSGGIDCLRTLAISRLALDNLQHVQDSWVTQGPKIGQVSLYFGADDPGSIMLDETVVAAAGVSFRMTRAQIERLISDAGFTPRQRRTLYEPL